MKSNIRISYIKLAVFLLIFVSVAKVNAGGFQRNLSSVDEVFSDTQPRGEQRVKDISQRRIHTKSEVNTLDKTSSKIQNKKYETKQTPETSYKVVQYTFKEINLLKEDMVLRGISPAYDLYIPIHNNLVRAKINLKLTIPTYLRKDSSVSILVDDVPQYTITMQNSGQPINLEIRPRRGRDFVKVSIRGNLRLSDNICEDVFSDKPYLIIHADSTVNFSYKPAEDIRTFLIDYERQFCIEDRELLPLVYYISKSRVILPVFNWGIRDNCQKIVKMSKDNTKLEGNILYVNKPLLEAIQYGYEPFIFGKFIQVEQAEKRETPKYNEVSLKELGIRTATIKGMSNISFHIPFNLASFGGMPDTLYFRLNFAHTPAHQKDKMELRVYLNDTLIKTLPLEGYGTKGVDIKIPFQELSYGHNSLVVNLVNFTSSDNCFGAVTQSVLTVFDNSYFYWNSVNKRVKTIADFFKMINGRVGLRIEDNKMLPLAVRILNMLPEVNKSIGTVEFIEKEDENYDYILSFVKPDSNKGLFEVYDPVEKRVVFSAKYELPFVYLVLKDLSTPELKVSLYGNPDVPALAHMYSIEDYLNLYGNVAVISESYFASFETGDKLRLRYERERGIGYYWMKYRLLIIILLSIPVLYLLMHTYRKLTRRTV